MKRLPLAFALLTLAAGAQASALMDVQPGVSLDALKKTYASQFLYQKDNGATFIDMLDRYPAYSFYEIGNGKVTGSIWLSQGSAAGQQWVFNQTQKRLTTKGAKVLQDDQITACPAMKGGRAFRVNERVLSLSNNTRVSFNQMPTFSSVAIIRGVAQKSDFKVPGMDDKESNSNKPGAYRQTWQAAMSNQMHSLLSSPPGNIFCNARHFAWPDKTFPIVVGKPFLQGDKMLADGEHEFPHTWMVYGTRFPAAGVTIVHQKVTEAVYEKAKVPTAVFNALAQKLQKTYGEPHLKDHRVAPNEDAMVLNWPGQGKEAAISLQFARRQTSDKTGILRIITRP